MVYYKRVKTTDRRFSNKSIGVYGSMEHVDIPIPDSMVICNGCNKNIYPDDGYLVYLGKRELAKDEPYDIYCEDCRKDYFPKAKESTTI